MSAVIEQFYKAFANVDSDGMKACYHNDIVFEDPAFGVLKGTRAKAMWQMLCDSQKDKDFKIIATNIKENDLEGFAHWEAFYTFSKTGRKVHNKIDAVFTLKDGLIIKHTDHFNLHHWAKQALGFKGLILGKTSYFKTKLNQQTNRLLDNYMQKKELL